LRAVSVFSSSTALFGKLRQEKGFSSENLSQYNKENFAGELVLAHGDGGTLNRLKSTYSRVYSVNSTLQPTIIYEITKDNANKDLMSLAFMIIHYGSG